MRIVERPVYDEQGTLKDVSLDVELPAAFPEKYREPLLRVIEQCSVKKAIAAQPTFTGRAVISGSPALLSAPAPATSSLETGAS